MLALAVYPVAVTPAVYINEHMKPALDWVQDERRAGDCNHVCYGAAPVVAFVHGTSASIGGHTPLPRVAAARRGDTSLNYTPFAVTSASGD